MTFRTLIILLIWLILKATNGISQDIFWVVEGDTGKMYNKLWELDVQRQFT